MNTTIGLHHSKLRWFDCLDLFPAYKADTSKTYSCSNIYYQLMPYLFVSNSVRGGRRTMPNDAMASVGRNWHRSAEGEFSSVLPENFKVCGCGLHHNGSRQYGIGLNKVCIRPWVYHINLTDVDSYSSHSIVTFIRWSEPFRQHRLSA